MQLKCENTYAETRVFLILQTFLKEFYFNTQAISVKLIVHPNIKSLSLLMWGIQDAPTSYSLVWDHIEVVSLFFFIEHYISEQSRVAAHWLCSNAMASIKVLLSFILDLCKVIKNEMLIDQTGAEKGKKNLRFL